MILNEFDKSKKSTFNPDEVINKIPDFPKVGITCFSHKLLQKIIETYNPEEIAYIKNGTGKNPVYKLNYKGKDIAIFMSRVGAPACVVGYEEVIVMGLEKLVVFGTCGVLKSEIEDLAIIIPNSAIRDEGTSYHYLDASDEIEINSNYKEEFKEVLEEHNYSFIEGKVWTTDAPYRETKNKVIKRKEQGCICVDMECASLTAVAKFRNKEVFQFFYAADNLDASKWDQRSLGNDEKLSKKENIVLLALELANKIS